MGKAVCRAMVEVVRGSKPRCKGELALLFPRLNYRSTTPKEIPKGFGEFITNRSVMNTLFCTN